MKDFMLILRGGAEKLKTESPEFLQANMAKWQTWMGGLAQEGRLVGGQPLDAKAITLIDGGTKTIDRPLAEGKELIGGYVTIKANSLEEAVEIAKGCPACETDSTIEVRELMVVR